MRYVTDLPYLASFIAELAPEWLALVATICGLAAPDRKYGYRWCELGCGRGLTTVILAAARPDGRFMGIDMMPDHIESARRTAASARCENCDFHAVDFAAADVLGLEAFDFIVAHGVYSWIDEVAAADFRRFVDRHLAPGGLLYISYNSLPGWAADAPFQYLLRSLADAEIGPSDARLAAAVGKIEPLLEQPVFEASPIASGWAANHSNRPVAYLTHEYLAPAWRPRYVSEVRAAMRTIELEPVGSATLQQNFDSMVLRAAARAQLETVTDADLRELVRDYFLFQRFRRDVYTRAPRRLDDTERSARLLETPFALVQPVGKIAYEHRTEAGVARFDNPVARGIVSALARGARPAGKCRDAATSDGDLIANALTLACAGIIEPALARPAAVDRINSALRAEGPDEPSVLRVLPSGPVLRFGRDFLAEIEAGRSVGEQAQPWSELLAAIG